jgi:hypothetical protein
VGDFALFVSYLWFTTQVPSELGTFYGDYKVQEVSIDRLLDMIRPEKAGALVEYHPVYTRGPLPKVAQPEKRQPTAWKARSARADLPLSRTKTALQGARHRASNFTWSAASLSSSPGASAPANRPGQGSARAAAAAGR